ncbi:MAG: Hsp70 family protein, partial [Clostridia bacterium]
AMRGVPQIEVTFDIDANGIVSVTAADKGTGKTSNITITASSNLSDSDIDAAVKEAEKYAEEDKKRKEMVDMKNDAEQLILATDKAVTEAGDKISAEDKEALENASKEAKENLDKAKTVEEFKAVSENLSKVCNPIFTKLYQQANPNGGANPGNGAQDGTTDDSTINVNPDDIQ